MVGSIPRFRDMSVRMARWRCRARSAKRSRDKLIPIMFSEVGRLGTACTTRRGSEHARRRRTFRNCYWLSVLEEGRAVGTLYRHWLISELPTSSDCGAGLARREATRLAAVAAFVDASMHKTPLHQLPLFGCLSFAIR